MVLCKANVEGRLLIRRFPGTFSDVVGSVADTGTIYKFKEIQNGWAKWDLVEINRITPDTSFKPFNIKLEGWSMISFEGKVFLQNVKV